VPARIRGDSPLKRAGDVGHELGLSGIRKRDGVLELAVDDPYRPGGKDPRVEWRPAKEVRRFAYRDSDQDLTAVITVRIGSWTAESLMRRQKDARISAIEADAAKTEARLRARIKELEAAPPGDRTDLVAHARAAGWESALVQVIAAAEWLRTTGDTP
jgi:hypothetical protein